MTIRDAQTKLVQEGRKLEGKLIGQAKNDFSAAVTIIEGTSFPNEDEEDPDLTAER